MTRENWRCVPVGPRCSAATGMTGALREMFRRRLVSDRRPGQAGRGRLLLVRRQSRRRDQDLRPFDRPVRGGERVDRTQGGRRGRRDREAGPCRHGGGQSFRSLRPGFEPSDELRLDLLGFGRRRLGAVVPKEIAFDQNLPHTRSGKVMRRLLKARELGLPEGDLSTLEAAS